MTDDRQHGTSADSVRLEELEALRAIVEGTARTTGKDFFPTLARQMASAMQTGYAFVAEFAGQDLARTLGYWKPTGFEESVTWNILGTPCQDVVTGKLCHYPRDVARLFPDDAPMVEWGIDSYLGVPLVALDGQHLGHLAVFDTKPMPDDPRKLFIFRIFAARAVAELERLRSEQLLRDSEQRFRDLFDEAPIAYVHEGLDSQFISANAAALRILGVKPEEIPYTKGLSLVPGNFDAQRRANEAFASIGRGTDTSGVVLELRRKDNGKPIWIQWWSKPDPGGQFTRTMFVDITDHVLMQREKARLEAQNLYLQEEIKSVHNFDEIIGRSPPLVSVLEGVRRVAATDASVLIYGETGTGKELIARAIHSSSTRKDKPLIKVNCAALPTGLVESELFGHERGAFSGAIARRIGRFELANGGTIFLDEIGEIPLEVQAKLLRVLQEREFERVGGSLSIKVDVRIIAATNRDLLKVSRDGKFREDLYYRLNVFPLHLPPLRERHDDIPMLVQFLLDKFAARIGRRMSGVTPETMARLCQYAWPGNIRELENLLERAVILSTTDVLDIDQRLLDISPSPPAKPDVAAASVLKETQPSKLEDLERSHILAVLNRTNWVIEGDHGAAKILDLHPNTLRSRLKKMGLSRASRV
jgi:PAS domain S-box-containing protein